MSNDFVFETLCAPFTYTQTPNDITFYFAIPAGKKVESCKITARAVVANLQGETAPFVDIALLTSVAENASETGYETKEGKLIVRIAKSKRTIWSYAVVVPVTNELQQKSKHSHKPVVDSLSAELIEDIESSNTQFSQFQNDLQKKYITPAEEQVSLGKEKYDEAVSAHFKGDALTALKLYEEAANLGFASAFLPVGDLYSPEEAKSHGIEANPEKSFEYLFRAAVQHGDQAALLRVADLILKKQPGVPENFTSKSAVALMIQGAIRGDANSMFELGRLYWQDSQLQNYAKANQWEKLACSRGHFMAAHFIGIFSRDQVGTTKSYTNALKYFKSAQFWSGTEQFKEQIDGILRLMQFNFEVPAEPAHVEETTERGEDLLEEALTTLDIPQTSEFPKSGQDDIDEFETKPQGKSTLSAIDEILGELALKEPVSVSKPDDRLLPFSSLPPITSTSGAQKALSSITETTDEETTAAEDPEAADKPSFWWKAGEYAVTAGIVGGLGFGFYSFFNKK